MMSIMKLFLALTLPCAIFAETYYGNNNNNRNNNNNNNNCRDNANFWWRFEFDNQVYQHGCSFLTNSSNNQQNLKRQQNHCHRTGRNGVLVRNACRRSCNNCRPNNNPPRRTPYPTPSPTRRRGKGKGRNGRNGYDDYYEADME